MVDSLEHLRIAAEAIDAVCDSPYNPGVVGSPTVAVVAKGVVEDGPGWDAGLSEKATFGVIMETWAASGAKLQPPCLQASSDRLASCIDKYKGIAEGFNIDHDGHKKSFERGVAVKAGLQTVIATGLALYWMHTCSPVSMAKAKLVGEEETWKNMNVTFHAAVKVAMAKVLKLKKP